MNYVVPYSAITYLLDPSGEFRTHFTDALEPAVMTEQFTAILHEAA